MQPDQDSNAVPSTNPSVDEPQVSNAPQQNNLTVPPEHLSQKRSRKKLVALVTMLVLVIVGGVAYALLKSDDKSSTASTTAPKVVDSEKQIEQKGQFFYVASGVKSISTFSVSGNSKATTNLSNRDGLTTGLGSNAAVQTSKDGSKTLYSAVKYDDAQDGTEGEGGYPLESTIILKEGSTETEVYKGDETIAIDDTLINPAGTQIFYTITSLKNSKTQTNIQSLYLYDVASKKSSLLKQDFMSGGSSKSPLTVATDGTLRFYVTASNSMVTEYSVKDGVLATRALSIKPFCSDCRPESGQPLSPDGKKLILEGGSIELGFKYFLLDLDTMKATQVYKQARSTEQPLSVFWSPDSQRIAYSITANGQAGQEATDLDLRFEILDVTTQKITKGFGNLSPGVKDPSYNQHFVQVIGWSPDGDYIAFSHGNSAKLFHLSDQKVIDSGISGSFDSTSSAGWYKR